MFDIQIIQVHELHDSVDNLHVESKNASLQDGNCLRFKKYNKVVSEIFLGSGHEYCNLLRPETCIGESEFEDRDDSAHICKIKDR